LHNYDVATADVIDYEKARHGMRPHIAAREATLSSTIAPKGTGQVNKFLRMPPHLFNNLLAIAAPLLQRENTR
jgi:hypothetical protein